MKYRVLGRTGLVVSEIGLGGHEYRRFFPSALLNQNEVDMEKLNETQPIRNEIVKKALEAGVNYFDTTFIEEAVSLEAALKHLEVERRRVHIAAMVISPFRKMDESPKSKWADIVNGELDRILKALNADYVDVFNLTFPEDGYSREKFNLIMDVFIEAMRGGKVRSIGCSSHEPRFLAELLRKYDCFDVVMVRYNYHLQEARDVLFPLCKLMEVGVVVMKPFSWPYYGIPFMKFGPVEGEEGSFYTPAQLSLRWILKSPEVSTVVPSANSLNELEENLAAVSKEEALDEKILDKYLKTATGPEAREKLRRMLNEQNIDVKFFAERALSELEAT